MLGWAVFLSIVNSGILTVTQLFYGTAQLQYTAECGDLLMVRLFGVTNFYKHVPNPRPGLVMLNLVNSRIGCSCVESYDGMEERAIS
jgi:hypothetical protein